MLLVVGSNQYTHKGLEGRLEIRLWIKWDSTQAWSDSLTLLDSGEVSK